MSRFEEVIIKDINGITVLTDGVDKLLVKIPALDSSTDSVEVLQDTHDDLNANANLQVSNTDVSPTNPVPVISARVSGQVLEYAAIGGGTNKINYVVTTGKNLFISHWHVAVSEGKGNIFELQDDGVSLAAISTGEDGGPGYPMSFPGNNPIGPIAAGSTVRIHRDTGDSGKDWSGGFMGYEEDE